MQSAELMRAVADLMEAQVDATTTEMVAEVLAAEPALQADRAFVADVEASCRANIRRFLMVARRAEDPPPADAPLEALDVARSFVRRGVDTGAMYQAYRRGQQVLWRHWMGTAETIASGDDLARVLNPSLEVLFTYVDAVLGHSIAEMERERQQVLGGALARRAETIRLLLDGAPIDARAAATRLNYGLAGGHTALVLSTEGAPEALETTAVALARRVGTRNPLMLSAGVAVLWAWIGSPNPVDLAGAPVPPGVRVAVGPTRSGAAGFRLSHEGALTVHRLLSPDDATGALATYDELEVTVLAARDEARARDFVSKTLGPLAADTAAAARLRETLRVFLDEAENAPRAALRLHAHRNTVLQRVRRASGLLGHPPGERRLAVELALELRRRLGPPDAR